MVTRDESVEIICSSPQGSIIDLMADSSFLIGETHNQSHITITSTDANHESSLEVINETQVTPKKNTTSESTDLGNSYPLVVSSPDISSAQVTSFRLRSPMKKLSPLKKLSPMKVLSPPRRRPQLVGEDNFIISDLTQSSPQSSFYCTAGDVILEEEPQYERVVSKVEFIGDDIETSNNITKTYTTRVIPLKRKINDSLGEETDDEIPPSSADEGDTSLIEITRNVKMPKSVIQVPSSPGFENFDPSPTKSSWVSYSAAMGTNDSLVGDTALFEIKSDSISPNQDETDENEMMEQFENMTMNELRQKIMQFGLKPSNSKYKMLESLKNVFRKVKPETKFILSQSEIQSQPQGFNLMKHSQNLIKFDIHDTLNKKLSAIDKTFPRDQQQLLENIYTFQPIKKLELRKLFIEELSDSENDQIVLKSWCDWNSIILLDEE